MLRITYLLLTKTVLAVWELVSAVSVYIIWQVITINVSSALLPMTELSTWNPCIQIQKKHGSPTGNMIMLTGIKNRQKELKKLMKTRHIKLLTIGTHRYFAYMAKKIIE